MAPKKRAKSAAAAEAPSVVYMLRWSLRNTIEEFDDDVFVDCYGDELDMAREAAKDELEKDENDCSSVAYSTKLKANEAAAARFVEMRDEIGCAVVLKCEEEDDEENEWQAEDDEGNECIVEKSCGSNGLVSFEWEFISMDEEQGHEVNYKGSIRAVAVPVQ